LVGAAAEGLAALAFAVFAVFAELAGLFPAGGVSQAANVMAAAALKTKVNKFFITISFNDNIQNEKRSRVSTQTTFERLEVGGVLNSLCL
jgi:hypothetical protein